MFLKREETNHKEEKNSRTTGLCVYCLCTKRLYDRRTRTFREARTFALIIRFECFFFVVVVKYIYYFCIRKFYPGARTKKIINELGNTKKKSRIFYITFWYMNNRLHENPFQMKTYCKMVGEGIANSGVYIYKRIETCVCVCRKRKKITQKKKSRHMMHDEKAKKKKNTRQKWFVSLTIALRPVWQTPQSSVSCLTNSFFA